MLPREHGAYGQIALPLVTSLALAGVTLPGALIAVTAVAAFLAHEPLVVLLGHRGARARRERRRPAVAWLCATGGAACAAGVAALSLVPPPIRAWMLLPLLPAAWVGVAIARNREKTESAEAATAVTFALVAVPLCLASGASLTVALAVALAFAAVFVAHTLAVRTIILRVRGGGDARRARATRAAALAWTAAAAAALAAAAMGDLLPWIVLLSTLPGLVAAVVLTLRPPAPSRLRTVGWTLAATAASTAVILVA